jgi:hypothetical protein
VEINQISGILQIAWKRKIVPRDSGAGVRMEKVAGEFPFDITCVSGLMLYHQTTVFSFISSSSPLFVVELSYFVL